MGVAVKAAVCELLQGDVLVEPGVNTREYVPAQADGEAGRGEFAVSEREAVPSVGSPMAPLVAWKLPSLAIAPVIGKSPPPLLAVKAAFVHWAKKAACPVTILPSTWRNADMTG